jgi:hypothetical protein
MRLGQGGAGTRQLLQHAELVEGNDLDVIDITGDASQAITDRGDEPTETVKLDRLGEGLVDLPEELAPGRGQLS